LALYLVVGPPRIDVFVRGRECRDADVPGILWVIPVDKAFPDRLLDIWYAVFHEIDH